MLMWVMGHSASFATKNPDFLFNIGGAIVISCMHSTTFNGQGSDFRIPGVMFWLRIEKY